MNSRDGRLRSPRSMVLLLAALTTALAALAGMLWLRDRGSDGVPLQGEPMTDAQAAGQVVASAKQIVGTAQLHDAAGGYAFVSCKNENEPPYQVAIYMTFPPAKQSGQVSARRRGCHGGARVDSGRLDGRALRSEADPRRRDGDLLSQR